ncbi:hypothetical protein ACPC54_38635 [Kitasatospora sp. NPDC094028]
MSDETSTHLIRHEPSTGTLRLDEVTPTPVIVKLMGRTYTATLVDDAVDIRDHTDITSPHNLGTARPGSTTDHWEVTDSRGASLTSTADLLHTVALLRRAQWPPLDQAPLPRARLIPCHHASRESTGPYRPRSTEGTASPDARRASGKVGPGPPGRSATGPGRPVLAPDDPNLAALIGELTMLRRRTPPHPRLTDAQSQRL